jgi:hypothetical protein
MRDLPANSDRRSCPSLQAPILAALAASFSVRAPSELTSLSLENLLVSNFTPLDSSDSSPLLTLLMPALRRFHLSVCNNIVTDDVRWRNFWSTFFSRIIPAPVQHSLTDLEMRSNIAIGSSSGLSFAGLYFPHLSALSLYNFFWEPYLAIEPFVLRHATTLAQLKLIFCCLPVTRLRLLSPSPSTALTEAEELSTSWEHIWDRFALELTALVALHTDIIFYAIYVPDRYIRGTVVGKTRKEADGAALLRFHTTVAARSEEMRRKS